MGYVSAISPCLFCERLISSNPMRVPSWPDKHGVKQPICRDCIAYINEERKKGGFRQFPIYADSYAACDEGELE